MNTSNPNDTPEAPPQAEEPRSPASGWFASIKARLGLGEAPTLREAAELDIPPRHHVQHLVVHGLLHLTGFDHDTDEEAEVMEALETRILATLDIPDPYTQVATKAEARTEA